MKKTKLSGVTPRFVAVDEVIKQNDTVMGIMPIRMKRLQVAMIHAFLEQAPYHTRIFPHLTSAVLLPVTRADRDHMGLIKVGDTNTYIRGA